MVSRLTGPLQTYEIKCAEKLWIKINQETTLSENRTNDGIWRINSQIHGYSPILLPRTGDFTKRLIEDYQRTFHGEVQRFVTYVRDFGFPN